MAVFQAIERLFGKILGVAYYTKNETEYASALKKFDGMMENSQKRIWVVCGEFKDSIIAGNEKFAETIKSRITKAKNENMSFEVCLLFSKNIPNDLILEERKKIAIEQIKRDNEKVVKIFISNDLNPDMKYLKMYWANKRPKYHFHLSDNNLFLEKKHEPHAPREVLIIKNDKKFADKYENLFKGLIKMKNIVEPLKVSDFE
jgi:hypothetical protein